MNRQDGAWRLLRLRRWVTAAIGNISLGLLSLGIALALWVYVTNSASDPDRRTIDMRVQVVGVPRNFQDAGVSPETVHVTIDGPRNAIRDLRPSDIIARADVSGSADSSEAQQEFTVDVPVKVDLPRGSLRAEPVPERVAVTLERQERRDFKVQIKQVGVPPPGYQPDTITIDETDVVVSGARRNVSGVEAVVANVPLDGQTVSFNRAVTLEARDRDGRTVGGIKIAPDTANVTVKLKQNLYQKDVVVNVPYRGRPKTGYTVTSVRADPQLVSVTGPLEQVNALAGVSTETVDIEGAAGDVVRPVRLQLPSNLTTAQPIVLAMIALRAERAPGSIAVVPRVTNLGAGLNAQLATPAVAVNVSGPLGDVVQVRATDVSVTVDASGLGPGTHKIDPKVALLMPTLQLEGVVPDKIEIIITPAR